MKFEFDESAFKRHVQREMKDAVHNAGVEVLKQGDRGD